MRIDTALIAATGRVEKMTTEADSVSSSLTPDGRSPISFLEGLPEDERLSILSRLTPEQQSAALFKWQWWARPDQLMPGTAGAAQQRDWTIWTLLGGRGAGKTRGLTEAARAVVETNQSRRMAIVGRDAGDVRDTVIEGESGILAVSPPWFKPRYEPSKRRLTWPNGARATIYSSEDPESLRGPQHDFAICDELGAWKYPRETWDMLQFGLRLGPRPRQVIATTPRPIAVLKEILRRSDCVVSRETTYANRANLPDKFFVDVISKYENTRLGRQELLGHLLEDTPGALWTRDNLDKYRAPPNVATRLLVDKELRDGFLTRIVVAIDPPASSEEKADECGISVAGKGKDGHGYVLADLSAGRLSPAMWAARAVEAYREFDADLIVAEVNQGGEMVKQVIRQVDANIKFKAIHATRGKALRAEPVALKYEQGMIHHCGLLPHLEDQMCVMTLDFDRKKMGSPDRLDAAVYALTELMLGRPAMTFH